MQDLRRVWPALVVALATAACAHAPPPARVADACTIAAGADAVAIARVPFELVDGRVYVQAHVNGRGPFRFAVDTGASGMGRADARLAKALGLANSGSVLNSDGVRTTTSDTTRLASLELGGLVRHDVEVITRDYAARMSAAQRFDGIIGRDFFADGLLVIDYPRRRLSFTRQAGIPADAPGSLAYEKPFRVPVSIGGVQATGHLDSGANVTAVLPMALYQRVSASPLQQAAAGQLSNGSIDASRAVLEGPVVIGGARLAALEVRVSAKFPELLIGAHVLQDRLLAIDQRTRRVALCDAGPG